MAKPRDQTRCEHLSKLIREARTRRGLNQQDAAAECGYTREQFSRFESGVARPDIRRLETIANALGIQRILLELAWIADTGSDESKRVSKLANDLIGHSSTEYSDGAIEEIVRTALETPRLPPALRDQAQRLLRIHEDLQHLFSHVPLDDRHIHLEPLPTKRRPLRNHDQDGSALRLIGHGRIGLSYSIVDVCIDPGHAGIHRHKPIDKATAGAELFVLYEGQGELILCTEPKSHTNEVAETADSKIWEHRPITKPYVGFYPPSITHCFVNPERRPMRLLVFCTPFPVERTSATTHSQQPLIGIGRGYRLNALPETIPADKNDQELLTPGLLKSLHKIAQEHGFRKPPDD